MANYYFTIPDSVTLPTDGNKVSLTTACELHRDDSALPNALTVAADSYNVFLADTPGTGTATAPDVTAPTLSSPTGAKSGETGATSLGVSTNEGNGTLYWGIYPTASTPSAADVVAGTGATVSGSQAVSGTGVQSVSDQTGLTAGTAYKAHYVQDDAASNRSSVATSSEFTTDAAASSDSFFEDWTDAGYSINDEVATLSNWAANADLTTGGATASLFDNGGTTMLRADTANTGMRAFAYDGSATIGADRRITVQLAQIGDTTSPTFALIIELHYASASEYMRLLVSHNGDMGFRQAGMGTSDWDRFAQAVTDTSEIQFEHDSGSIICRLDGVQIGSTRTITTPPATWSQPMIRVGNGTDNTIVESINLETLP